ncbi:MAG: DUF6745 domain-containing protein [Crocosphaera sp.]
MITQLSEKQITVLSTYIEKWKAITSSTQLIEQEKAKLAIKNAYEESNYPEPEIIFFGSPFAAIKKIIVTKNFKSYLGRNINKKFRKRVWEHLFHLIKRQLDEPIFYQLINQILYPGYPNHLDRANLPKGFHFPMGIENCVEAQLFRDFDRIETDNSDISNLLEALTRPVGWSGWVCMFDFCISILGVQHDHKKWHVVKELMQYCDFIFQFENVCIVCDRPCKLSFDRKNRLHAEWEYALQFADGYGVYAYHGGECPEGKHCKNNEYLEPGTKVKLPSTGEYGIVVHCWYSNEIYDFDCYVAFYGTSFPDPETDCRPYIFRYAAVSLEILE